MIRHVLKAILAAAAGLVASDATVRADMITPTEAVNNWVRFQEPVVGYNIDYWKVAGTNGEFLDYDNSPASQQLPMGQVLASDFIQTTDFVFSFRIQTTRSDGDIWGAVFGWQDTNNHYRLDWDAGGLKEADFKDGLHLFREVNGVNTELFYPTPRPYYERRVPYDVTVGRTGNRIFINIDKVGGPHIADFSTIDTAFMTGRVGVFNSSQNIRVSNINFSSLVPEPSSLVLVGLGGAIAFGCCWRLGRAGRGGPSAG